MPSTAQSRAKSSRTRSSASREDNDKAENSFFDTIQSVLGKKLKGLFKGLNASLTKFITSVTKQLEDWIKKLLTVFINFFSNIFGVFFKDLPGYMQQPFFGREASAASTFFTEVVPNLNSALGSLSKFLSQMNSGAAMPEAVDSDLEDELNSDDENDVDLDSDAEEAAQFTRPFRSKRS